MLFLMMILCGFFEVVPSGTADSEAKAAVRRMEAAYRSAKTLQATFLERYSEGGHTTRVESGRAYFRRPGKMRFDYEVPEKNLFLVDGKYAWFYVPMDHTVTRVPAKESADWRTPLALLAGEMKVSRVCAKVEFAAGEKPVDAADILLHCTLRGSQQESSEGSRGDPDARDPKHTDAVFFEVVRESGQLARILVRQAGEIEVEFRFTQWQFDPQIADSQFRFEPPMGVAIVNGELPAQNSVIK